MHSFTGRKQEIAQLQDLRAEKMAAIVVIKGQRELGIDLVDKVREKIKRLSIPRGFGVSPVLVHSGGVSPELDAKGFFYRIIDLRDLDEQED